MLARGLFPTDENVSATTVLLPKAPTVHTPVQAVRTPVRPAQDPDQVLTNVISEFLGRDREAGQSHHPSQQFTTTSSQKKISVI